MQFKGQLLLPGEAGPGLKVNLDVAEHHLAVESDGGGLGAWPLEAVEVERLHGDLFSLTVAGEALRFVADDTIGFAYSGVPAIGNVRRSRGRSGLRSVFDWIKGPDHQPESVADETPPVDASRQQPVAQPVRETKELEAIAGLVQPPTHHEATLDELVVEDPVQAPRPPAFEPLVATPVDPPTAHLTQSPTKQTVPLGTTQCPAVRSDGRQCESQILTESGYCYPHDPRRAFEDGYEAAQEARAQLKKDATGRLNRIYGRLEKAMRQVERGELDPETAMAMAQLARTMCAILEMDESTPEER